MSNQNDDEHFEHKIGYRSPPLHSRFKPGETGNPNGRPKSKRRLGEDVIDELNELICVTEDGRDFTITKQRAIAKSIMGSALRGDLRAAAMVAAMSKDDERDAVAESDADRRDLEAYIDREVQRRLKSLEK